MTFTSASTFTGTSVNKSSILRYTRIYTHCGLLTELIWLALNTQIKLDHSTGNNESASDKPALTPTARMQTKSYRVRC
jgi:hypothetical protein